MKSRRGTSSPSTGEIRIIGGRWRSRKVDVPPLPGVRPSASRFRETLFNWLAPRIEGAACLDLFAGSGVLGLEALSRGASRVTFVDSARAVVDHLQRTLALLDALSQARTVHDDALRWLTTPPPDAADCRIAFIDPPFHQDLLPRTFTALAGSGVLANNALVYFEAERDLPLPALPPGWTVHRHQQGGQVQYGLIQVDGMVKGDALHA